MMKFTLLLFTALFCVVSAFGPKKLYTLELHHTVNSVRVIGRQVFFVGPWYISVVDNIQWKFMAIKRMNPRIINKDIANPRLVGPIPAGTFKGSRERTYWVTTWGTNETSGAVYVLKQTADYSEWGDISIDSGWNYEQTQWIDMDRDGLRDCLTARFRGGVGQLLWFKQPPGQTLWGQRIIHEGMADGNFLGFIYDKQSYIIIAGNQFNTLGLYWTMNRRNNWSFSRQVRHRVVDNYGRYFDIQYIDLNKDGRRDILTTTIQISSSRGHVLGYEIPYDIRNKLWRRRVLATGFTGDYSPGKATAYWPNKWKRKSDRPSIFLSGAGEEKMFILSPTPRSRGWKYIKSSLKAGAGMIGIPFIVDLNGDSYPEIFVPQGSRIHVFSYDYKASAATPSAPVSKIRRPSATRAVVRYRPPFFRPTTPAPKPAIPAGAKPVGPSPDNTGGGVELISKRKSSESSFYPVYPSKVRQPNGAGSVRLQPLLPYPFQTTNISTGGQKSVWPQLQPFPSAVRPVISTSHLNPVLGSDGRWYQPLAPQNNLHNFPSQVNSGLQINSGPNIVSQPPTINKSIVITDIKRNRSDINATDNRNDVHSGEDFVANLPDVPINLVLSVTKEKYAYQSEASDACGFQKQVLCDLNQLQDAVDIGGEVPEFEWGWFATKGRAAALEECNPGHIKWEGYVCHNGMVEHLPVLNQAKLPGLCCSVVNWATVTNKRFSRMADAEKECRNISRHLCTLSAMGRVWTESSYKGYQWNWFKSENRLIRMSHYCDTKQELWRGYQCLNNKLEISEINSNTQQKAFCCPNCASNVHASLLSFVVFCYNLYLISLCQ